MQAEEQEAHALEAAKAHEEHALEAAKAHEQHALKEAETTIEACGHDAAIYAGYSWLG